MILAREIATARGLAVGDSFTATVEGKPLTLTVSGTVRAGFPMILFDAAAQGISYNMLLVSGREGVDRDALLRELTAATASELTGILPTDTLLELKTATFEIYSRTAVLLLLVTTVFSLIGLLNSLLVSYRERREEFMLYAVSGMQPHTVRRMKALEIAGVLTVGLLMALLVLLLSLPLMQYTLSASHDHLVNLGKFFGK